MEKCRSNEVCFSSFVSMSVSNILSLCPFSPYNVSVSHKTSQLFSYEHICSSYKCSTLLLLLSQGWRGGTRDLAEVVVFVQPAGWKTALNPISTAGPDRATAGQTDTDWAWWTQNARVRNKMYSDATQSVLVDAKKM